MASSGAFSQARHEWKVEVFAQPSVIWSVRVPRLVADARVASPSEREALDALLADLGSTKGRPEVSLRDDALVLSGRGDASVTAARSFYRGEREAFLHWTATGADVSPRRRSGGRASDLDRVLQWRLGSHLLGAGLAHRVPHSRRYGGLHVPVECPTLRGRPLVALGLRVTRYTNSRALCDPSSRVMKRFTTAKLTAIVATPRKGA